MNTIKHRRGAVTFDITNSTGQKIAIPPFVIPGIDFTGSNRSGVYVAFTMATTPLSVLTSTGESVIALTNANMREYHTVKPHLTAYNVIAATARRKPGTTGIIVSQTITVYKDDTPDQIIGVFDVVPNAVDAGDPSCGFFVSYNSASAGDTRCNLQTPGITISATALDTDLEIVLWMVGV